VKAEIILGGTILLKTDARQFRVINEISEELVKKICKDLGVPKTK